MTIVAKLMLTNALFLFVILVVESSRHFYHATYFRNSVLWNYHSVSYMKSLVTVIFLLFSVSRCPKVTGVPSPTISMVQRTALRLPVNFLLKQVTVIRLRFRQNSGLFSFGLDRSLRDQARWHFT